MRLFDREMGQTELARHCGASSQFFGVRATVLADGLERGIRCLEFRTGTGFRFSILVDRAMDISDAEYRGASIGWHSPSGFRHPGLHENGDEEGLAWLRSFSGLMVTAGLDHTLFMARESADHYNYPGRKSISHPLHGRVANIPAKLQGYGEQWDGEDCTLWCEGTVIQATVFGENLHLIRRIEAKVGASAVTVHDRVINRGFSRTPHMLLYHINLGYPLFDAGSQYIAPIRRTVWASHADSLKTQNVGYLTQPGPMKGFREQVFEHELAADQNGKVATGLVNRAFAGGQGLGFVIEVDRKEFPCHFQWQNYQEGMYAIGVEPSTNHAWGREFAKERAELRWLEHGDERRYTTTFRVLEDNRQIEQFVRRISSIQTPPIGEFPLVEKEMERL